jgi:HEAT repeat protein
MHYPGVYTPASDWVCNIWRVACNSFDYAQAERESALLRKSVTDDSLPYYVYDLIGGSLRAGGRVTDAMLLGMIKCVDAAPELLEAATHDSNYEMRAVSVEALGEMCSGARAQAQGICRILLYDVDLYVKRHAAKACGRIGEWRAASSLRDMFDNIRPKIRYLEAQGYPFEGQDKDKKREMDQASLLLEDILVALFRLDQKSGREALAEGLNDSSSITHHFSKRAFSWFDYYSGEERIGGLIVPKRRDRVKYVGGNCL